MWCGESKRLGLSISGAMMVEGWGEGGRDGVDRKNKEIEFMSQCVQFPALNQAFQCLRYLDISVEHRTATWSDVNAVLGLRNAGFVEGFSSGACETPAHRK